MNLWSRKHRVIIQCSLSRLLRPDADRQKHPLRRPVTWGSREGRYPASRTFLTPPPPPPPTPPGLTCTLGITNDLIDGGQPRAKNGFKMWFWLYFTETWSSPRLATVYQVHIRPRLRYTAFKKPAHWDWNKGPTSKMHKLTSAISRPLLCSSSTSSTLQPSMYSAVSTRWSENKNSGNLFVCSTGRRATSSGII